MAILLCLLMLASGWTWVPADAAPARPEAGAILLDDHPAAGPSSGATVLGSGESLLTTLKQVNPDYSTIHIKELSAYRGNLVILPLPDNTTQTFLNAFMLHRPKRLRVVIVPMLSRPNNWIEGFLRRNGFSVSGMQYLFRSAPLTIDGKALATTIPLGTFVIKANGRQPAMAHWGDDLPAAMATGNTLLINWNWLSLNPDQSFKQLIALWPTSKALPEPDIALEDAPQTAQAPSPTPQLQPTPAVVMPASPVEAQVEALTPPQPVAALPPEKPAIIVPEAPPARELRHPASDISIALPTEASAAPTEAPQPVMLAVPVAEAPATPLLMPTPAEVPAAPPMVTVDSLIHNVLSAIPNLILPFDGPAPSVLAGPAKPVVAKPKAASALPKVHAVKPAVVVAVKPPPPVAVQIITITPAAVPSPSPDAVAATPTVTPQVIVAQAKPLVLPLKAPAHKIVQLKPAKPKSPVHLVAKPSIPRKLAHALVPKAEAPVTPLLTTPATAETPATVTTPTPVPEPVQAQPAVQSPVAAVTHPPVTAMTAPPRKDDPDIDSNPAELYDFDGKPGTHKETPAHQQAETQDNIASFYNDRMREFGELQNAVNALMTQTTDADKRAALTRDMEEANHSISTFENAWFGQNLPTALAAYDQAKTLMMRDLFDQVPTSQIEGRAIWLDRGSIIAAGNEANLRQLIRRIAASGLNVVYFETINAGYPIYPSAIVPQNPQVRGWDPLAVAVDEAHKQGIELHAWVWTFAVGNIRHNRLLGLPDTYPGPLLSRPELATEALKGRNGEMVLPEQYEYWLSPASSKARAFLISYFTEIIKRYDVDGLQLDYIRYPFQKPHTPMGLQPFEMARFQSETGLSLAHPDETTNQAWLAWKAFQVTTFVRQLSTELRSIKPDLKLSAAVFPIARHNRMLMIQQDWETWVQNGWIDTLSPMAYSKSPRSLEHLVQYIHNVSGDKTLVYPGLSLKKLNAIELLDTLEICRRTGVMGTTLFAVTQFDKSRQLVLQSGPYKQRHTVPPHRDPLGASVQLVRETRSVLDSLQHSATAASTDLPLNDLQGTLSLISQDVGALSDTSHSAEAGFLISRLHDNVQTLTQEADQLDRLSTPNNNESYQARLLKSMLDKVVMMVNYTVFQLSNVQHPATEIPAAAKPLGAAPVSRVPARWQTSQR